MRSTRRASHSLLLPSVLNRAVLELEAAPYLLRGVKGMGFGGWRDVQFEGLMYLLAKIAKGSEASETIRVFLRMKTGAGKTLVAFEGLLPLVDVDSAARGKKSMFLTVQSNLKAQANLDYRSLKKLRSKIEIDLWEEIKSKIAQGRLSNTDKAEDYWIIGDEMDGAALQAALSIGEITAGISRFNPGNTLLAGSNARMKEIMGHGPRELRERLDAELSRQRSVADGLAPGEAAPRLSLAAAEEVDRAIAGLAPSILSEIEGRDVHVRLDRAHHRNMHLDEIEKALGAGRQP